MMRYPELCMYSATPKLGRKRLLDRPITAIVRAERRTLPIFDIRDQRREAEPAGTASFVFFRPAGLTGLTAISFTAACFTAECLTALRNCSTSAWLR